VANAEVRRGVARRGPELIARNLMSVQMQKLATHHEHEGHARELAGLVSLRGKRNHTVQRSAMLLCTAVFHIAGAMFMLT
jgi:hypothetical protein